MPITASKLRAIRNGVILRIVPEIKASKPSRLEKLARLPKRKCFIGDPDDLVKSHWLESGGYEEWLDKWKDLK